MAKNANKTSLDTVSSLHDEPVAKSCDLFHTPDCTKHTETNVVVWTEHMVAKDALHDAF